MSYIGICIFQNETEGYERSPRYPVPAYVPMLKENIAYDRRGQACNRKALPLNDSGINCDYIGDDEGLCGDKVKIVDKVEEDEIVSTEEKTRVEFGDKGFDCNSLMVAANVEYTYSTPTKSKDSVSVHALSPLYGWVWDATVALSYKDVSLCLPHVQDGSVYSLSSSSTDTMTVKIGSNVCVQYCGFCYLWELRMCFTMYVHMHGRYVL